jgi:hypothetical protein
LTKSEAKKPSSLPTMRNDYPATVWGANAYTNDLLAMFDTLTLEDAFALAKREAVMVRAIAEIVPVRKIHLTNYLTHRRTMEAKDAELAAAASEQPQLSLIK